MGFSVSKAWKKTKRSISKKFRSVGRLARGDFDGAINDAIGSIEDEFQAGLTDQVIRRGKTQEGREAAAEQERNLTQQRNIANAAVELTAESAPDVRVGGAAAELLAGRGRRQRNRGGRSVASGLGIG